MKSRFTLPALKRNTAHGRQEAERTRGSDGVPQGPEDAVEDGDRGELRRQVINSACRELGDCDINIGDENSAMESERMFVCSL